MINDLVQTILQRLSPTLSTLYAQYVIVRLGIGFLIFLPFTFLAVVLSGSWIFAYIIGLIVGLLVIDKGKGHLVQASSSEPTSKISLTTTPSVPPNDTVRIVDCTTCGGKGYIDSATGDPQTCTRCLGHGKLRLVKKSSDIPIIGATRPKGLMGQVGIPKRLLYMLMYMGIGGIVFAIGAATGQAIIDLIGLGIMGIGFFVFGKKKATTNA